MTALLKYYEDYFEVRFPYNQRVINELKIQIPSCYRRWISDKRAWEITIIYEATILRIFAKYSIPYIKIPQTIKKSSQPTDIPSEYRTLYLLPNAPREVVKASFRALSLLHHPDMQGGNAKRFREIKGAYDKIMRTK